MATSVRHQPLGGVMVPVGNERREGFEGNLIVDASVPSQCDAKTVKEQGSNDALVRTRIVP